jgi:N-acetylglucosaminyldiphosphoundecaprenol N-acetyl-beta-D-mannosaminyltransferase
MRINVLGVSIDLVEINDALAYVERCIQDCEKRKYILSVNAEKIMMLNHDSPLKIFFNRADLLLPDGVGTVIAARWLHKRTVKRITGVDLMENICDQAPRKNYRIFLYGAREEVNYAATENLRRLYPGIRIVGRSHGYLNDGLMRNLIDKINESKAHILFIALGSPKQEEWIREYKDMLNVNICQGIGGTLDIVSGKSKRSPQNIQRLGLEWLYRLIKEPKRIRRQKVFPLFLFSVLKEWLLRG